METPQHGVIVTSTSERANGRPDALRNDSPSMIPLPPQPTAKSALLTSSRTSRENERPRSTSPTATTPEAREDSEKPSRRRASRMGMRNYIAADVDALEALVAEIQPRQPSDWNIIAERFAIWARDNNRPVREMSSLQNKYNKITCYVPARAAVLMPPSLSQQPYIRHPRTRARPIFRYPRSVANAAVPPSTDDGAADVSLFFFLSCRS